MSVLCERGSAWHCCVTCIYESRSGCVYVCVCLFVCIATVCYGCKGCVSLLKVCIVGYCVFVLCGFVSVSHDFIGAYCVSLLVFVCACV